MDARELQAVRTELENYEKATKGSGRELPGWCVARLHQALNDLERHNDGQVPPLREITLRQAQENVRLAMVQKGKIPICPCCGQPAKRYRRLLNSNMAEALVRIVQYADQHPEEEWIDIPNLLKHTPRRWSNGEWGGDYAKLRYWGLLEQATGLRADGSSRNGQWKVTPLGRQFARGEIRLPSHALDFNGECLGLDNTMEINIRGVHNFNYEELIQS